MTDTERTGGARQVLGDEDKGLQGTTVEYVRDSGVIMNQMAVDEDDVVSGVEWQIGSRPAVIDTTVSAARPDDVVMAIACHPKRATADVVGA